MFRRIRSAAGAAGSAAIRGVTELPAAQDPAVQRYFRSRANWFFLAVAAIMYSIAWPTLSLTHVLPTYALPVVAAFAAFPIALAWSAPVIGWAISVVSAQLIGIIVPTVPGWPWTIQVTHLIELLVLTFFAYLRCGLRWIPVVWVSTSIVLAIAAPADARGGWVFGLTFLAVVVALLRFLLRSRRQLAESTEQTQLIESQKAILQERTRIARDLHDVVAHRMSVVVVMAQTARYRLDDVSEEAAAEFEAIAVSARASLDEVRQMLGVLRTDGDVAAAPNPGLGDIGTLVMQTRMTGAVVGLSDSVSHQAIGDASGLVIYRIVQESLANATRHAPGAQIEISLTPHAEGGTEVEVRNSAPTVEPVQMAGPGSGIPGMRERAAAVGGTVITGPTADGGFVVRALIPRQGHAATVTTDPTVATDPTVTTDPAAADSGARAGG
ncbi:sensor histidine kinase [Gordonia insulae]|uniref:histidine kinase n=1 Tax=Gordonia insulae TaxID=2420509 RepID=A0A3G8JVG5_9ACTN|nr:histidine kinase [Gordonia insulae]AZG48826.1 Sensor histidine kinase DesK [Gordonia insulae]